jgi:serine/threonine-protein kinase HipA
MVNGKRENITDEDFLEVARKMNIKKPEEKIENVKTAIRRWKEFADKVNVEKELRDAIQNTLLI